MRIMLGEMARVATECVKHPRGTSIWSAGKRQYVHSDSEEGRASVEQRETERRTASSPKAGKPPVVLNEQFKLVFATAAGGTLLFTLVCVALTLAAGRDPPPLTEKLIMGLLDLAKIGFGAVVGLLGGKTLSADSK